MTPCKFPDSDFHKFLLTAAAKDKGSSMAETHGEQCLWHKLHNSNHDAFESSLKSVRN